MRLVALISALSTAALAAPAPVFDADCRGVTADASPPKAWAQALAQVKPKGGWGGWARRPAPELLQRLQGTWQRADKVITKTIVGDEERVQGTTGRYHAKLRAYVLVRGAQRVHAVAWRFQGRRGAYLLNVTADRLLEFGGAVDAPSAKATGRFSRVGPPAQQACDKRFGVERDVRAARARDAFVALWPRLRPGAEASRRALVEFLGAHRGAVRVGERAEVVPFPEVQVARSLLGTYGDEDAPTDQAPVKPPPPPKPIEWVAVAGGRFAPGHPDGGPAERPGRRTTVKPFELSKTEITNGQYARCVQAQHCTPPRWDACVAGWRSPEHPAGEPVAIPLSSPLRAPDHPVVCVSWAQARRFAEFAGGRLPSEAEWAFTARAGGERTAGPWDRGAASCWRAVMHPEGGQAGCGALATAAPCSKAAGATAQGHCDLVGNAAEWVADWFGPTRGLPRDGSARAKAPGKGELRRMPWAKGARAVRGGGWRAGVGEARATFRGAADPKEAFDDVGFRVARTR